MDFRQWMEIVDFAKPSASVKKSKVVKNPGTNAAKQLLQFRWRTKLGNDVKLQLEPKYDDAYNVVFYVNDTLYDDSSKTQESNRDPEILSGVFYVLQDKAERLNIKELTFTAFPSDADTKIVRNLPYDDQIVINYLNKFKEAVQSHIVKFIDPSQKLIDLYVKLNKPLPQTPDIDQKTLLKWADDLQQIIKNPPKQEDGSQLDPFVDYLKQLIGNGRLQSLRFNVHQLEILLFNLSNAYKSHSNRGWLRNRNRRLMIYTKLVPRYFPNWKMEVSGTHVTLTNPN